MPSTTLRTARMLIINRKKKQKKKPLKDMKLGGTIQGKPGGVRERVEDDKKYLTNIYDVLIE